MGFSFKKIVNNLDSVSNSVYSEVSEEVKNKVRSVSKLKDSTQCVAVEVCKETSKYMKRHVNNLEGIVDNTMDAALVSYKQASKAYLVLESAVELADRITTFVVNAARQFVDFVFIKKQVHEVVPEAFKIKILEKKRHAVNVGIFTNNIITEQLTITSDVGISDEIYQGQIVNMGVF